MTIVIKNRFLSYQPLSAPVSTGCVVATSPGTRIGIHYEVGKVLEAGGVGPVAIWRCYPHVAIAGFCDHYGSRSTRINVDDVIPQYRRIAGAIHAHWGGVVPFNSDSGGRQRTLGPRSVATSFFHVSTTRELKLSTVFAAEMENRGNIARGPTRDFVTAVRRAS